jgi:hypothetical protein
LAGLQGLQQRHEEFDREVNVGLAVNDVGIKITGSFESLPQYILYQVLHLEIVQFELVHEVMLMCLLRSDVEQAIAQQGHYQLRLL